MILRLLFTGLLWFADELFGPGQPLDTNRYYIILPDNIGHGDSSRPGDGQRTAFPRYRYSDMVALQYRLLTESLGFQSLCLTQRTPIRACSRAAVARQQAIARIGR